MWDGEGANRPVAAATIEILFMLHHEGYLAGVPCNYMLKLASGIVTRRYSPISSTEQPLAIDQYRIYLIYMGTKYLHIEHRVG